MVDGSSTSNGSTIERGKKSSVSRQLLTIVHRAKSSPSGAGTKQARKRNPPRPPKASVTQVAAAACVWDVNAPAIGRECCPLRRELSILSARIARFSSLLLFHRAVAGPR